MQRAAGGFDYRLRLVVPDLQPIDELEPASCTRKCLAAEALRGHSAECGGVARPLQNGRRPDAERRVPGEGIQRGHESQEAYKPWPNKVLFASPALASMRPLRLAAATGLLLLLPGPSMLDVVRRVTSAPRVRTTLMIFI